MSRPVEREAIVACELLAEVQAPLGTPDPATLHLTDKPYDYLHKEEEDKR